MKIIFSYLCLFWGISCLFYSTAMAGQNIKDCDPVVKLGAQTNTLQKTLSLLAKQHNFELSFPVGADKPVESVDGMRLSQALKYLTTGVNTVFQHKKVVGCSKAKLVSIEVLPVGEQGKIIHVKSKPVAEVSPQTQAKVESVYIDDMDQYIEDVLLRKRKRERNLSLEQRKEFAKKRRQVRQRLEAEGLLEPRAQQSKKSKLENRKSRREPK